VPFEFNKKNQRFRYSVYLRYWYKSTNTDAAAARELSSEEVEALTEQSKDTGSSW
jgi:hypothetical protein